MAGGRGPSKRHKLTSACLWALLVLVAILPRSAGAFVLHSHTGHGLHVHAVSGLEDNARSLDRDVFHARHHAHEHADHADEAHLAGGSSHSRHAPHGDREVFLGLPSEPVRTCAAAIVVLPPLERCAAFFAAATDDSIEEAAVASERSRPTKQRGRVPRTGLRALARTSSAFRI